MNRIYVWSKNVRYSGSYYFILYYMSQSKVGIMEFMFNIILELVCLKEKVNRIPIVSV